MNVTLVLTTLLNAFSVGESLAADDTLVISGGLYDGSQIYNPTMTTTDMTEDEFNFEDRKSVV